MRVPAPKEFARFTVGSAHVVAHHSCEGWARGVLEHETLYEWAARQPDRRTLQGRVPAYSVELPTEARRVVVRHSQHGGLLAPLTRDLFLPPTRAPYELLASYVLSATGVRTPPVLVTAVYRVNALLRRSDVVTLELPGRDLGESLAATADGARRGSWIQTVAQLLRALTGAGAWHPDLNVKNILLVPDASGAEQAFVLDVDRIQFAPPGDPHILGANLDRLTRSMRKWREHHAGAGFSEDELRTLRDLAAAPVGG